LAIIGLLTNSSHMRSEGSIQKNKIPAFIKHPQNWCSTWL